jgi:D-alanine-D-alanine ligase
VECRDNLPYSVEVKENYQQFCKYHQIDKNTFEECSKVSLNVWKALDCVDAGRVDLKADRKGSICFMEVNPLAGLNPVHSDLPILARMSGMEYQDLLENIVNAALKRNKLIQ